MGECCEVCFRHCRPEEGNLGVCLARRMKDGKVVCDNYGKLTETNIVPVTKIIKNCFDKDSRLLAIGSYGCNLFCPACQNHRISDAAPGSIFTHNYQPEEIVDLAKSLRKQNVVGVAYTYNEPLVSYEFVRDTAKLCKEAGLKNVLVTNGTAELNILKEILPYIDAMNIDLKGFDHYYYKYVLKGDINMVLHFIEYAVQYCHVEITTLLVPNQTDNEMTIRMISYWLKTLEEKYRTKIPFHISRFYPANRLLDKFPTNLKTMDTLTSMAQENLSHVYQTNHIP